MIDWIKSKLTKHKYIPTRTTNTGGQYYRCSKCKRQLYLPLEWSYSIDVKKIKGCRG